MPIFLQVDFFFLRESTKVLNNPCVLDIDALGPKLDADRFFRQTGIISCFAFQQYSSSVIAVGSYDKNIGKQLGVITAERLNRRL